MPPTFYLHPSVNDNLRQGDIFKLLPRAEVTPSKIYVNRDDEVHQTRWIDVAEPGKALIISVTVMPVFAVVVTQDCDASREGEVSLCQVDTLPTVSRTDLPPRDKPRYAQELVKRAREQPKWFYLPPDDAIGFVEPMAVDFESILRLPTEDLMALRAQLRVGRLRQVALKHFQRKIVDYFTRYAYNEWYPLTKSEADSYSATRREELKPRYSWQRPD